MRISDWSSDVCSSDLLRRLRPGIGGIDRRSRCPGKNPRDHGPLSRFHRKPAHRKRLLRQQSAHQQDYALCCDAMDAGSACRSEEHTSELQSLMRISYAVFCLKKKIINTSE